MNNRKVPHGFIAIWVYCKAKLIRCKELTLYIYNILMASYGFHLSLSFIIICDSGDDFQMLSMYFCHYIPLEKSVALHLCKLESP